jgi:DNA-binding LacI/PurR family transcriptional regulator
MTTIQDVAEAAGVSVSTVSYVLSGKRAVSEETRARILQIMEDMGYQPTRRWYRTIAVSTPISPSRLNSPDYLQILGTISATVNANDSDLLMVGYSSLENHNLQRIRLAAADGVLLLDVEAIDPRVEFLRVRKIPFVLFGRCADSEGLSYVDKDMMSEIRLAFDHLYQLGHRRIGLVAWQGANFNLVAYRSLCQLALSHHLSFDEQMVAWVNRDQKDRQKAVHDLLQANSDITALIATDDELAIQSLMYLRERGIAVPEQMSIIGIGGGVMTEITTPAITVVQHDRVSMAKTAVDQLVNLIDHSKSIPVHQLFAGNLVLRASTAPRIEAAR